MALILKSTLVYEKKVLQLCGRQTFFLRHRLTKLGWYWKAYSRSWESPYSVYRLRKVRQLLLESTFEITDLTRRKKGMPKKTSNARGSGRKRMRERNMVSETKTETEVEREREAGQDQGQDRAVAEVVVDLTTDDFVPQLISSGSDREDDRDRDQRQVGKEDSSEEESSEEETDGSGEEGKLRVVTRSMAKTKQLRLASGLPEGPERSSPKRKKRTNREQGKAGEESRLADENNSDLEIVGEIDIEDIIAEKAAKAEKQGLIINLSAAPI